MWDDSNTFLYADEDMDNGAEETKISKKEKIEVIDSKNLNEDSGQANVVQNNNDYEQLLKDVANNNTTFGLNCFNTNQQHKATMDYQRCLSETTVSDDENTATDILDERNNNMDTESDRQKRGNSLKNNILKEIRCECGSQTTFETKSMDRKRYQSELAVGEKTNFSNRTTKDQSYSKIDEEIADNAATVNYSDDETYKEKYVELIHRTDKQVNDFQLQAVENQNTRRMYNKLKKLFVALSVINIILIMVVISVMPITMVSFGLSKQTPFAENIDQISNIPKIDEEVDINDQQYLNASAIKTMLLCVSCSKLRLELYQSYWERVFIEDGKCCFQDTLAMVTSLVRHQNRQSNHLYTRIRRLERFVQNSTNLYFYNATANNGDDDDKGTGNEWFDDELNESEALDAVGNLINRPRSVIHLKNDGRFHKIGKNYQMKWSANTVYQGDISSTGRYIQVSTEGYYYIYSHVLFSRNALVNETRNVTLTFNLSKTNYGMSKTIERVQQRCMFREGTLEHQSTIQTIVLLNADDKIHINFPAHELAFVSRDYGAHALGMFKL